MSSIPDDAEMCSGPQELQGARAATATRAGQQVVLLLAPAALTDVFACPIGGDGTEYTLYMAEPPTP
ncbi:MAG: hypothetical protein U0Q03_18925 [Acidimicrobiales bacterium]